MCALRQAAEWRCSEDTELGTYLRRTMVHPTCWWIQSWHNGHESDRTWAGVQCLNVTSVLFTTLQRLVSIVSPVDSVTGEGHSPRAGATGELKNSSEVLAVQITWLYPATAIFCPIQSTWGQVYGQPGRTSQTSEECDGAGTVHWSLTYRSRKIAGPIHCPTRGTQTLKPSSGIAREWMRNNQVWKYPSGGLREIPIASPRPSRMGKQLKFRVASASQARMWPALVAT